MKKTLLLIILSACFACGSQKNIERRKTYEISNSVTLKVNNTDSINVYDLRFSPIYDPTDLQKFMFNEFGKWDNPMGSDTKLDYLIWSDIKLFEDREEFFTVAIGGEDRKFEIIKINGKQKYAEIRYCSAIVVDSKGKDCFRTSSDLKQSLVEYFISGAESVKREDPEFEEELN